MAASKNSFRDLGLCDTLVEACERRGWKVPTKIQAQVIPEALGGNDVIGLAETGSGKTGAFVLPILQALLSTENPKNKKGFVCVLSPTRELAVQISDEFKALGPEWLHCAVLFGGLNMVLQAIDLARSHIVVATPGRLLDHLSNTPGFSLCKLRYLVLDEADRLLSMEFEKAIDEILVKLPKDRNTFLFSATMTNKVRKLQRACRKNRVKVEASAKYSTVDTCEQKLQIVPAKHKACYLLYILTEINNGKSMVFTRTCESTQLLALLLRELGLEALPISGRMTQQKRLEALDNFKAGECDILVCTDVASRGLDVPSVDLVINYDIPNNPKDYFHRVGRTARAGQSGLAISLVNEYDVEWYLQIEKLMNKKLPELSAAENKVLVFSERVSLAQRRVQKVLKGSGSKIIRKRGNDSDEEDEDGEKYAASRKRSSSSKTSKRRK